MTRKHGLVISCLDNQLNSHCLTYLKALQEKGHHLSLLHVLPSIPSQYYQIPSIHTVWKNLRKESVKEITGLAKQLGIPLDRCCVVSGHLEQQVEKYVKTNAVDFLIEPPTKPKPRLQQWLNRMLHPMSDEIAYDSIRISHLPN